MSTGDQEHWNQIYNRTPIEQLGWYEVQAEPSLRLVRGCALEPEMPIIDIGAGASTLMDGLLALGFIDLTAVDISPAALAHLENRLNPAPGQQVHYHCADITQPVSQLPAGHYALWHDRAMLHFLLTEAQRQAYRDNLIHLLAPQGYVIIAAFAPSGAQQCSGLEVYHYDTDQLTSFLGSQFRLLAALEHTYQMPAGGLRPFTYALFQSRT